MFLIAKQAAWTRIQNKINQICVFNKWKEKAFELHKTYDLVIIS